MEEFLKFPRIQSTSEEIRTALKKFGENMKEYTFTEEDIIEFFSDKENKDACKSFIRRHPECIYEKYIPKDEIKFENGSIINIVEAGDSTRGKIRR